MSVTIIARFTTPDLGRARQALASNAAVLEEVSARAKTLGARHHRFVESGGELLVIDEWDSAEAFQGFFTSDPQVPQIVEAAGIIGQPRVEVLNPVEAAGTF